MWIEFLEGHLVNFRHVADVLKETQKLNGITRFVVTARFTDHDSLLFRTFDTEQERDQYYDKLRRLFICDSSI